MDCRYIERNEIVGQYLTGKLSPDERQAFEEHYFGCSRCFDELQTLRATQAELAANAPAIRAEPVTVRPALKWAWAAGVAALALVVLVLSLRPPAPEPQAPPVTTMPPAKQAPPAASAPSLADLARVEPPAYTPAVLRGTTDEARRKFSQAMQRYTKQDYRSAIPGLREAVRLNPRMADATFFLGICYLLTDRTDAAIARLRETIALGDTPFLEEAHFYLAKAFLRKGELKAAYDELEKTIQLKGERENEARQLLRQLEAVSPATR